jgi:hypothetical protein
MTITPDKKIKPAKKIKQVKKLKPTTLAERIAIRLNPPNVHIDKIHIYADCYHEAFGDLFYFDDLDGDVIPGAAAKVEGNLKEGGGSFFLRSKQIDSDGMGHSLELECCPPKVLQKHNLFGHCNLIYYVYTLLDLITRRKGISIDEEQKELWHQGKGIRVTEVHLTANFRCPREHVLPIIDALDQNHLEGKQRVFPTSITLGRASKKRSDYHSVTVYDKHQELKSAFPKPGQIRTKLIEEAAKGIRVEVRLAAKELKLYEFYQAYAWWNVDVVSLYFDVLNRYNLTHAIQRLLTTDEEKNLTRSELNIYKLWLHGERLEDLCASRTSRWKYQKSIFDKTGVDISGSRRPEPLPKIDLKQVFSPGNTLPVPEWAKNTEYYFPCRGKDIGKVPVHPDAANDDRIWVEIGEQDGVISAA